MRIKQVHLPFSSTSQCENICSSPSPALLRNRWRRSSQFVINISSRLEEGVSRWQVALCVGTLPPETSLCSASRASSYVFVESFPLYESDLEQTLIQ